MTSEVLSGSLVEAYRIPAPEVVVLPTEKEVDAYAFKILAETVVNKPRAVLTLATGSSPLGLYDLMADAYKSHLLDFRYLTTKNLDEYWPLPEGHPQSYGKFMEENLFNRINIPSENRHIPYSGAADPDAEVTRYRSILKNTGCSDLAVLGIGPGLTCHIAFNERGSSLDSRTRLVEIDDETVRANARFFAGNESLVPRHAITQGVADILESKRIILIAKGTNKAEGIKRALEGEISQDAPASFLRLHPNVTFILDKGAACLLTNRP